MIKPWAWSCTALFAALAWTRPAAAQSTRLPDWYVARGLVAPDKTLRIDGGPHWEMWAFPSGQLVTTVTRTDAESDHQVAFGFNPGVSFGVTHDFELGLVLPTTVAPDFDMHNPLFHLTWRFVETDVELGLFARIPLPVQDGFSPVVGLPMFVHASRVRIDTGFFLMMHIGDRQGVDGIIPFLLPIQATDSFFLGPEFALVFPRFDGVSVPLGMVFGWTLRTARGTLGDLALRFRFIDIERNFDAFQILFGADFYFDL